MSPSTRLSHLRKLEVLSTIKPRPPQPSLTRETSSSGLKPLLGNDEDNIDLLVLLAKLWNDDETVTTVTSFLLPLALDSHAARTTIPPNSSSVY